MRYWLFNDKARHASGPHLDTVLVRRKGFTPESKVAPEGTKEWKPAKDFPELVKLFPPPPPSTQKPK